jgi:hypothetical protein
MDAIGDLDSDVVLIDIDGSKKKKSESSVDSRNPLFTFEPWDSSHYERLNNIAINCRSRSKLHGEHSKKKGKIFKIVSIPLISIPVVLSTFEDKLNSDVRIGFLLSLSLIGALNTMFNFGGVAQRHTEYFYKYTELAMTIESELVKHKKFRDAVETFTERVNLVFLNLLKLAPPL